MSDEIKGYWWCPNCKEEIDGGRVTNQEMCDTCGHPVEWIEPKGTLARVREQVEKLQDEESAKIVNSVSIVEGYGLLGAKEAYQKVLDLMEVPPCDT